jgi:hypothetical protein
MLMIASITGARTHNTLGPIIAYHGLPSCPARLAGSVIAVTYDTNQLYLEANSRPTKCLSSPVKIRHCLSSLVECLRGRVVEFLGEGKQSYSINGNTLAVGNQLI